MLVLFHVLCCFAELCADKFGFSRADQDAYAAESVRRACAALQDGHFTAEITPVPVPGRGGGVSMAQGAAYGYRTSLAGGIGILRDDAGNDSYTAEMFAQGVGYYYGIGLLWDRGGNDKYQAVRYAQGNGVHEAVGVLRDEQGGAHYEVTVDELAELIRGKVQAVAARQWLEYERMPIALV